MRGLCSLSVAALLLAGCAGDRSLAPVSERGTGIRQGGEVYRTVVSGDTLYSIAWEAGQDYRSLAAWNGIRSPYLIKPGQRLRLSPPGSTDKKLHTVAKGETLYAISRQTGVPYGQIAAWNGLRRPYLIRPGQTLRLTAPGTATATASPPRTATNSRTTRTTSKTSATQASTAPASKLAWQWPAEGAVLSGYKGNGGNKGIDIKGEQGAAVRAAAPGRVVYQGSGLRGYGKLIIIKHNASFLSAYAHCDRIYVKEGDVIKRGQSIAGMGSSGTNRVKLHFEIRYRGNPVNPLIYLPKK